MTSKALRKVNGSTESSTGLESKLGRFASLRRGRTLGRTMRDRLSSSLYGNSRGSSSDVATSTADTSQPAPPNVPSQAVKPALPPRKTNKARSKLCEIL